MAMDIILNDDVRRPRQGSQLAAHTSNGMFGATLMCLNYSRHSLNLNPAMCLALNFFVCKLIFYSLLNMLFYCI
jgi:hypothetical protein